MNHSLQGLRMVEMMLKWYQESVTKFLSYIIDKYYYYSENIKLVEM